MMVGLRLYIINFLVDHFWMVGVINETNLGIFGQNGTIDEIVVCFLLCGSCKFDDFVFYFERINDFIEKRDFILDARYFGTDITDD
jgi:hypothetical protein